MLLTGNVLGHYSLTDGDMASMFTQENTAAEISLATRCL